MITFVINNIGWRVKIVPPTYPILLTQYGTFTLGCCDTNTKIIYIADGLYEDKFLKVLAHEIVHAAMYSYDVRLTEDQEELLADVFSTYGNEIANVTNKVFKKIKGRL